MLHNKLILPMVLFLERVISLEHERNFFSFLCQCFPTFLVNFEFWQCVEKGSGLAKNEQSFHTFSKLIKILDQFFVPFSIKIVFVVYKVMLLQGKSIQRMCLYLTS